MRSSIGSRGGGAYKYEFDEDGFLKVVQHRLLGKWGEVPKDLKIDRPFVLEFPASDEKACLAKGALRRYLCCNFFGPSEDGAAPHEQHLDRKGFVLKGLFTKAAEEIQAKRQKKVEADAPLKLVLSTTTRRRGRLR